MKMSHLFYLILSHLNYIIANINFEKIKIPQFQKKQNQTQKNILPKITINKTEDKKIRKIDDSATCDSASSYANSYDDCSKFNNEENNTICCYVTGVSGSTDSSGCLEVHILFLNKTLEYSSDNVSGKLICTSSKSSSFFLSCFLFYFIVIFVF